MAAKCLSQELPSQVLDDAVDILVTAATAIKNHSGSIFESRAELLQESQGM